MGPKTYSLWQFASYVLSEFAAIKVCAVATVCGFEDLHGPFLCCL